MQVLDAMEQRVVRQHFYMLVLNFVKLEVYPQQVTPKGTPTVLLIAKVALLKLLVPEEG